MSAVVELPISGDSNQYVLHAWNLVHHGEFSTQVPGSDIVVDEDHRGPGYPLLIAAAMIAAGHSDLPLREGPRGTVVLGLPDDTWMQYVYAIQAVLGAATVLLTIAIARFWLSRRIALACGCLVALWPHMVASTDVLLVEVLFSFVLVLSIYMALRTIVAATVLSAGLAGLCFGLAYWVNPVIAVFVLFVGAMIWARSTPRRASVFLIAFAILPVAWNGSMAPAGGGLWTRAAGPLVVGSWPQFYAAYNSRFDNAVSAQIIAAYSEEQEVFDRNASEGFRMMKNRMSLDPVYYLQWYLLSKPYLLWDWVIRIGPGEFYTRTTHNSPYDTNPLFRASASVYKVLNPIYFFSALLAAGGLVVRYFRHRGNQENAAAFVVAALFFYVTIVYSILQSEPRYSTPFRPFEVMLAMTVIGSLWHAVDARRSLAGD